MHTSCTLLFSLDISLGFLCYSTQRWSSQYGRIQPYLFINPLLLDMEQSTSPVSRDWVRPSPAAFRPTSRFHQAHSSDLCQRESNGTGHCWSQAMIRAPSHDAGPGGAAHILHLLLLPRTTQEWRLGSSNFLHLHFSFLNHRTQILQPTEFTS